MVAFPTAQSKHDGRCNNWQLDERPSCQGGIAMSAAIATGLLVRDHRPASPHVDAHSWRESAVCSVLAIGVQWMHVTHPYVSLGRYLDRFLPGPGLPPRSTAPEIERCEYVHP